MMKESGGWISVWGYKIVRHGGKDRRQHVLVAERALGHPLPPGAQVHHVNEDKLDNRPENLVICPDWTYHKLIHQRTRAFEACGHADWRKCPYCGQYDDPATMAQRKRHFAHRACRAKYEAERVKRKTQ